MLDNQLIKGISDHWDHCLKKIIIDVKSSYRNLRFQFFSRRADLFRSDALDWTPINDHCKNTKIEVFFGSEPNSRWRNDLFCDNYDNVSTTVVLLSKCNLIHRLDFKRTDFNDFVTNVRRGYDCMSPEYRHFTTYSHSNMLSFTKFLWMKPSLALSLKILNVDSVDWLNTDTDATENIEKFLAEENNLEELNVKAIMKRQFINSVFEAVKKEDSKLKVLNLKQVIYASHALEDPNSQEIPLREEDIFEKFKYEIQKLKHFTIDIILREEVTENINPKIYNNNLFTEWRNSIELETIDLTNDSDSD